jgi:hypothetical protein
LGGEKAAGSTQTKGAFSAFCLNGILPTLFFFRIFHKQQKRPSAAEQKPHTAKR